MCLSIKQITITKTKPKAKIANRNIQCYKIMRYINGNLYSDVRKFRYEIGNSYKASFSIRKSVWSGDWLVNEGLHSFSTIQQLDRVTSNSSLWSVGVKCVIPKGSKYYRGKNKDIVSNNLRIVRIIPKTEIKELIKKAEKT